MLHTSLPGSVPFLRGGRFPGGRPPACSLEQAAHSLHHSLGTAVKTGSLSEQLPLTSKAKPKLSTNPCSKASSTAVRKEEGRVGDFLLTVFSGYIWKRPQDLKYPPPPHLSCKYDGICGFRRPCTRVLLVWSSWASRDSSDFPPSLIMVLKPP